ncbi:MAG: phosphotransferase [Mobilitalea sp.]
MILIEQLMQKYGVKFEDIQLLRDWIGQVYIVKEEDKKYILKVFRKQYTNNALQSAAVMHYLKSSGFPVPIIVATVNSDLFFLTDDGRIAILYEYVEGGEPKRKHSLEELGHLSGQMRCIMEKYKGELDHKGREFYIDRYLSILNKKHYKETDHFSEIGTKLWNRVKDNKLEFCHGDFHIGNMIHNNTGIIIYDFDACGIAHPLYDIATVCDGTDYFDLSNRNFEMGISRTKKNVEMFLKGYNKYYSVNDAELRNIFDYIAIRHFDIQATIIECQGLDCVDESFLNNQYSWLTKWEDACTKV